VLYYSLCISYLARRFSFIKFILPLTFRAARSPCRNPQDLLVDIKIIDQQEFEVRSSGATGELRMGFELPAPGAKGGLFFVCVGSRKLT
jgi:hypothetical protein